MDTRDKIFTVCFFTTLITVCVGSVVLANWLDPFTYPCLQSHKEHSEGFPLFALEPYDWTVCDKWTLKSDLKFGCTYADTDPASGECK